MKTLIAQWVSPARRFLREEDGAQVVEYALIIALVSIALTVLLADKTNGLGAAFTDLVTRVKSCFAANAVTC
ncbi:MAG: Flp family type IVb pilin [Pseudomonadota bacterium]